MPLARRPAVALRAAERLLSPPSAVARRDARIHVLDARQLRAVLVHGRHGRVLATHRWHDGRLTLGYMPQKPRRSAGVGTRPDHPGRRGGPQGVAFDGGDRFAVDGRGRTASYAWRWAAGTLLDRHPRYQERFRQLVTFVTRPDFNQRFQNCSSPIGSRCVKSGN